MKRLIKQRPTPTALLQHKFVKGVRKCSKLAALLRTLPHAMDSGSDDDDLTHGDDAEYFCWSKLK